MIIRANVSIHVDVAFIFLWTIKTTADVTFRGFDDEMVECLHCQPCMAYC